MTVRLVLIEVTAGPRTCHDGTRLCRWVGTRMLGQVPICQLFGMDLTSDDQRDDNQLQRCEPCKGRER